MQKPRQEVAAIKSGPKPQPGASNIDEPGLKFRDWGIGIGEKYSIYFDCLPDPKNDPGQPFPTAALVIFYGT